MAFTRSPSRHEGLQSKVAPHHPHFTSAYQSRRIYGLDVLRAYAIFTVVYAHGYQWLAPHIDATIYALPLSDGVTIFFVLSGYLIGNILLRMAAEGRTSPTHLLDFLRRRWLRTVPAYILILLALMVITLAMGQALPEGVGKYIFFSQNFASPRPAFFPESWSLAVEEWFYVLFPVVLFALLPCARLRTALMISLAVFIVGPTILRIYRVEVLPLGDIDTWSAHVKMQVVTRLDSIAYGVAVAAALLRYPCLSQVLRRAFFAAGVGLFLFDKVALYAFGNSTYIGHFTLVVETVAAALVIPYLCTIKAGKGRIYRLLTHTSKISYSLYLVHLSIVALFVMPMVSSALQLGNGLSDGLFQYGLYWAASLVFAYALYRFVEKPIMRLRDTRWPDSGPTRSTRPVPVPVASLSLPQIGHRREPQRRAH